MSFALLYCCVANKIAERLLTPYDRLHPPVNVPSWNPEHRSTGSMTAFGNLVKSSLISSSPLIFIARVIEQSRLCRQELHIFHWYRMTQHAQVCPVLGMRLQ